MLSFDLHKWFLLNFQFSEKGRREQALKSKTSKDKTNKRKSLCKWFSCEVTSTQRNAVWLATEAFLFWCFRFPKNIYYTTVSNVKERQGGYNAVLISGRKWITQLPVNKSLSSFKYEELLHYFINWHLENNYWSEWCLWRSRFICLSTCLISRQ